MYEGRLVCTGFPWSYTMLQKYSCETACILWYGIPFMCEEVTWWNLLQASTFLGQTVLDAPKGACSKQPRICLLAVIGKIHLTLQDGWKLPESFMGKVSQFHIMYMLFNSTSSFTKCKLYPVICSQLPFYILFGIWYNTTVYI